MVPIKRPRLHMNEAQDQQLHNVPTTFYQQLHPSLFQQQPLPPQYTVQYPPTMPQTPALPQASAVNRPRRPTGPSPLQPPVDPTLLTGSQQLFMLAMQSDNSLKPTNPVTSPYLDKMAYTMWDVSFGQDIWMKDATSKGSMLPQLKLRALARLNYLPSWWYLREVAVELLKRMGYSIDDSEMQTIWNGALEWCKAVEARTGMGDNVAPKSDDREAPSVPEQVRKTE
ncbi:hypothetical protein G6514_009269 [Epicoccum nigrum]|nr:hypothetical protein G6514_009269 [Epicoccum nigrum]